MEVTINLDDIVGKELLKVYVDGNFKEFLPILLKYATIVDHLKYSDQLANASHTPEWYVQEGIRRVKLLVDSNYWETR